VTGSQRSLLENKMPLWLLTSFDEVDTLGRLGWEPWL